jgi:hypothetical protein
MQKLKRVVKTMNTKTVYEAEPVDVHRLSLSQLSICTHVNETIIIELVESEVLSPVSDKQAGLLFHPADLNRLNRAGRLMHEFELTPVGLALVFDLLDELRVLRQI